MNLRDKIHRDIWGSVATSVFSSVFSSVIGSVRGSVNDVVLNYATVPVNDVVRNSVRDKLKQLTNDPK